MQLSKRNLIAIALSIEFITGLITAKVNDINFMYAVITILVGTGTASLLTARIE